MTRPISFLGFAVISALWPMVVRAGDGGAPPPVPPAPYQNVRPGIQLHHLSPIEYFRALLGMSPAERERVLANKSAEDRKIILAKLQEYEALPPAVREARLRQTELRWEVTDLMRLAPAARAARLNQISVLDRPMVESRLREWDDVAPDVQKVLLEKQGFLSIYLRLQTSSPQHQQEILDQLPPEIRGRWMGELNRWQALPEKRRDEIAGQFQRFFSLTGEEQKQTVAALSEAERREMEKALGAFSSLPPLVRVQCINSFRVFATMAPQQRDQFLQNAASWEVMTPDERQTWREMVHKLPPMPPVPDNVRQVYPPFPPGFPTNLPPMPAGLAPRFAIQPENGAR